MQYETPIEHYTPEIADFLREFERKCRAPNMIAYNHMKLVNGDDTHQHPSVYFKDPKNPKEVAGVVVYHKSENKWVIGSRLITNNKFRQWSKEFNKKTTNGRDKALKVALQYILPYSYKEIAQRTLKDFDKVRYVVEDWYGQSLSKARKLMDNLNREVLMKEVAALKALGVKFQTPEFAAFAEEGLTLYAEYRERRKFMTLFHFVQQIEGDMYAVSTTTNSECNGYPKEFDKDARVYRSFDSMPENIQATVAMLKMLGEGSNVAEEGVRISDNQFVVLERVAKTETV